MVLRCPQVLHWESTSAHVNVTWHRNDSAVAVPGEEESRVWVQDGVLWIVPASQADSGTYICTVRSAPWGQEAGRGALPQRMLAWHLEQPGLPNAAHRWEPTYVCLAVPVIPPTWEPVPDILTVPCLPLLGSLSVTSMKRMSLVTLSGAGFLSLSLLNLQFFVFICHACTGFMYLRIRLLH